MIAINETDLTNVIKLPWAENKLNAVSSPIREIKVSPHPNPGAS